MKACNKKFWKKYFAFDYFRISLIFLIRFAPFIFCLRYSFYDMCHMSQFRTCLFMVREIKLYENETRNCSVSLTLFSTTLRALLFIQAVHSSQCQLSWYILKWRFLSTVMSFHFWKPVYLNLCRKHWISRNHRSLSTYTPFWFKMLLILDFLTVVLTWRSFMPTVSWNSTLNTVNSSKSSPGIETKHGFALDYYKQNGCLVSR